MAADRPLSIAEARAAGILPAVNSPKTPGKPPSRNEQLLSSTTTTPKEVKPATAPKSKARFYPSSSLTPDGLMMARLVGYTQEQLEEIFAFTRAKHGAQLYTR